MAPLPKRRHSSRRGGKRRAALQLTRLNLVKCPNCQTVKLPHRVCPNCGYYGGRAVVVKKEKSKKKT